MEMTKETKEVLEIFERIDREGEKIVKEAKEFYAQFSEDFIIAMSGSEK